MPGLEGFAGAANVMRRRANGGARSATIIERRELDSAMTKPPRIDIDDPDVDVDHSYLRYRGGLFSGEVAEFFGSSLISLDVYEDGIKNGPTREWYEDGTLRSEGAVRNGLPVGTFKEWHPDGTLASEKTFADDGLTMLADRHWNEAGQVTKDWRKDETA